MKKIVSFAVIVAATLSLAACQPEHVDTADQAQAKATKRAAAEANNAVGMPAIKNWTEKKDVKWLYELRDQANFTTFTYTTNMMGERIFLCNSLGMGINASIQFSNPVKPQDINPRNASYNYQLVPQIEPNGLFMPEGLAATYVKCITPDGDVQPVYVEDNIIVSPFKLD